MKHASRWLAGSLCLVAVAAVAVFAPAARSQIQATPSYLPIGVSAAGGSSVVWFHEPASRSVIACQSAASASPSSIQCATAKLP